MSAVQVTQLTRTIDAPHAQVVRAWCDPSEVEDWLFREPTTRLVRCMQLDARPGGLFRVRYRRQLESMPVEHHLVAFGAFTEHSPSHLALDYAVLQLHPLVPQSAVGRHHVQVILSEVGASTRVDVTSLAIGPCPEPQPWALWLDALERLFRDRHAHGERVNSLRGCHRPSADAARESGI